MHKPAQVTPTSPGPVSLLEASRDPLRKRLQQPSAKVGGVALYLLQISCCEVWKQGCWTAGAERLQQPSAKVGLVPCLLRSCQRSRVHCPNSVCCCQLKHRAVAPECRLAGNAQPRRIPC